MRRRRGRRRRLVAAVRGVAAHRGDEAAAERTSRRLQQEQPVPAPLETDTQLSVVPCMAAREHSGRLSRRDACEQRREQRAAARGEFAWWGAQVQRRVGERAGEGGR